MGIVEDDIAAMKEYKRKQIAEDTAAMKEYAKSLKPKGPTVFERLKMSGISALDAATGIPSVVRLAQGAIPGGKGYEGTGAQVAGQIAGDIGNVASVPLMFTKGAAKAGVNALIAGATGGTMGAASPEISKGIQGISNYIYNKGDFRDTLKAFPGLQRSETANTIAQLPGYVASTAFETLPAWLGLMGAKGKPFKRVTYDVSDMAKKTTAAGIPFTESAEAINTIETAGSNPKLNAVANKEAQLKINNTTSGEHIVFRRKQLDAMNKEIGNIAGKAAEMTMGEAGGKLEKAMSDRLKGLGQEYEAQQNYVLNLKPEGKPGRTAARKIFDYLTEQGVPSDNKGLNIKGMTGFEKIDPKTAGILDTVANKVVKAKSIEDMVNFKRNFDKEFSTLFSEDPGVASMQKKTVRKIIDDTIYDSIPDQTSRDNWKKVNTAYSERMDALDTIKRMDNSQEKIFETFGINKGTEGAKALIEASGVAPTKQAALQYLISKSRDVNGDINITKMKSEFLKSNRTDFWRAALGDVYPAIEEYIKIGEFAEAPQSWRGLNIRGGSQTGVINNLSRSENFQKVLPYVLGGIGGVLGSTTHNPAIAVTSGLMASAIAPIMKEAERTSAQNFLKRTPKPFKRLEINNSALAGIMANRILNNETTKKK